MGRVYFPTANRLGVRNMAAAHILGRYIYDGYRGPAEPAPHAAMTPANLGLGSFLTAPQDVETTIHPRIVATPILAPISATPNPETTVVFPTGVTYQPLAPSVTSVLPIAAPVTTQTTPTPRVSTMPAVRSSPTQVANTPVPVGFPTDSIFVNTDGSQWIYSAPAGTWINSGTPTNVNVAPGAAAAAPATTASTHAEVAGTPIPVGYPITSTYVDSVGNTWQFNQSSGMWVVTALSTSAGSSAVTATSAASVVTTLATAAQVAGTPVPVGTSNSSIYTDSSGNTWQFSSASGTWIETALATSASFTDQVAGWLGASTSIGGLAIPNAILAGIVALGVAWAMGGKKK